MSKYTTELRYICESLSGLTESKGYNNINDVIANSRQRLFDFNYPIFDETYRSVLETKIIKHFYTREIGEETFGLWKLRLDDKLNLIMPYYNKLYESELLKFNPLYDVDLNYSGQNIGVSQENSEDNLTGEYANSNNQDSTREHTIKSDRTTQDMFATNDKRSLKTETESMSNRENIRESKENNTINENEQNININNGNAKEHYSENDNGTNYNLFSDTPQGGLDGIEGVSQLPNQGNNENTTDYYYLTDARKIIDSKNNTHDKNNENFSTDQNDRVGTRTGENNVNENNNEIYSNQENYSSDETNENQHITNNSSEYNETQNRKDYILGNNYGDNKEKRVGTKLNNNTEDYVKHVIGKNGGVSYSKLLNEFRSTFINIDLMIMEELEPLFFGLW